VSKEKKRGMRFVHQSNRSKKNDDSI